MTAYQQLGTARNDRRRALPADPKLARRTELNRRRMESRRRAERVLVAIYPEVFEELLQIETAALDAERGPLPGESA